MWSCESWTCHQTLRFLPSPLHPPSQTPLKLKAALDPSAGFLVLSDIQRRVLYVLVLSQDAPGSSSTPGAQQQQEEEEEAAKDAAIGARVVSVSELAVTHPFLFLSVTDAAWKPYKRWKHDNHLMHHGHQVMIGW